MVALTAVAACVSSAPEVTGRLVDLRASPPRERSSHTTTRVTASAPIVRADAGGAYRIPRLMHVRSPLDAPLAPPAEQESVRERQRDHIAREPFWGPDMERSWRSKLTELEQFLPKE